MNDILNIPEVAALDSRKGVIRIPTEIDIPITGPGAADYRHGRISATWPKSANSAWFRWFIRRRCIHGSSTRWVSFGLRCYF